MGKDGEIIWAPSKDYLERANATRFMKAHGIRSYEELITRSQQDIVWFWDAVVRDLGIEFYEPYTEVLDVSSGMPWARWFLNGKLNVAHNCVDRWARQTPRRVAVVWEGEEGIVRVVNYAELAVMTNQVAHGLRSIGVARGDTVAIFMPLVPEAVAAMLACAKLGAIFIPLFSGFGAKAVASRLVDSDAQVLLTADGFTRRGSLIRMKEVADEATSLAGRIRHVVVFPRLHRRDLPWDDRRDIAWSDLVGSQPENFEAERLDSEHPLLILYTSGTTGRPKGAVHVHGGFLVKFASEVAYHLDLHSDETIFWVTDLGWLMGPLAIIGAGALGATVFLYDGAPNHPAPNRLWEMVERHRITTLGISPSLIRTLMPHGSDHVGRHNLSSLRILGSTGEPWNAESYGWYFNVIGGGRCPIINTSGGTEIGAFLSPLPIASLKPCTVRGPAPGMDVAIFGQDGMPIGAGEVGELVCKKPSPGMTRGIWRDPERYLDTYWRRWADVWVHGDWASVDVDGFWFLHGRSDDTLKVGGKRLGSGEVESALTDHPAVAECAAIGVRDEVKGEAVWCFVVAKPGWERGEVLAKELTAVVANHLGKAFTPARMTFVDELPKTRSAKIVRRAIRAAAVGADPGDISAVENPWALDIIRQSLIEQGGAAR
jgi:acetyl-CoA synthetase